MKKQVKSIIFLFIFTVIVVLHTDITPTYAATSWSMKAVAEDGTCSTLEDGEILELKKGESRNMSVLKI